MRAEGHEARPGWLRQRIAILAAQCPKGQPSEPNTNWVDADCPAQAPVAEPKEGRHVGASGHFPKRATRPGLVRRTGQSYPWRGALHKSRTGLAGRETPG